MDPHDHIVQPLKQDGDYSVPHYNQVVEKEMGKTGSDQKPFPSVDCSSDVTALMFAETQLTVL